MYCQPIKISSTPEINFLENFSLDPTGYKSDIFTEAVFINGRDALKPIEDQFQVIKDLLNKEIENNPNKFDPEKFIKNLEWKKLEDIISEIFGFRNVEIEHYNEKYLPSDDEFSTRILNCHTWMTWRYPIDGLVTDKGFYDSTRSINIKIIYSLGIIKNLTAGEITAIFLHEVGHNIDPALVDISYVKTNVISKYLTDRKDKLSDKEKSLISESKNSKLGFLIESILLLYGFTVLIILITVVVNFFKNLFFNEEKAKLKIREVLANNKEKFNRQNNMEAFADNFARMYGYGAQLGNAFLKVNESYKSKIKSRIKREKDRQRFITNMTIDSIKDVHKTDIHRIHSLIKEYKQDLEDTSIPSKVRKDIKEDLEELERVLDAYLNSSDEFSNQVNKLILEELELIDSTIVKSDSKEIDSKEENTKIFEEKSKSNNYQTLTSEEREIANKRFGKIGCSIMKDKDGYFAKTHRARTKSYSTLEDLPVEKVKFVNSTC